jgi:hypothetical protein
VTAGVELTKNGSLATYWQEARFRSGVTLDLIRVSFTFSVRLENGVSNH